jgi:hypothetical protein
LTVIFLNDYSESNTALYYSVLPEVQQKAALPSYLRDAFFHIMSPAWQLNRGCG